MFSLDTAYRDTHVFATTALQLYNSLQLAEGFPYRNVATCRMTERRRPSRRGVAIPSRRLAVGV